MAYTTHPDNRGHRQYLRGFAGPIIAQSEVRVYKVGKNGQPGRLLEIQSKEGKVIKTFRRHK